MKFGKSEKLNIEQGTENKNEEKELFLEKIPFEVKSVLNELEGQGYEAYMVGGCVRDILRKEKPNDYDVTTNAKPEKIQEIFPRNFYENKFGTVTVVNETSDATLRHIEITPFRGEEKYTDKRHPDKVEFVGTLEQDLGRRDFTVNAMAGCIRDGKVEITDPFNGQKDLKDKVIRAVGNPEERFQEDALRMIRAPRFATRFGFNIEKETKKAIQENAGLLSDISKTRIGNEFLKILESKNPAAGIEMMSELKIFSRVFPEIKKEFTGKNFKRENFPLLKKSVGTDSSADSRLALFFLDLKNIQDIDETKLVEKSLKYLRIPNRVIERINALLRGSKLVNDFEKLNETTARRLWKSFVLKHRIDDEVEKTMGDFITIQKIQQKDGQGLQDIENKEEMISKTSEDPLFINDLELQGGDIMKELKIKPGPKISKISRILLDRVIENPQRNNRKYLFSEAKKIYEGFSKTN